MIFTKKHSDHGTNRVSTLLFSCALALFAVNALGAISEIGEIPLNAAESNCRSAVIDSANGYAYFGTGDSPGTVVKVALGNGNVPPTRVTSLTLSTGENSLASAVIDQANGYAYFGTDTNPAKIVKVSLGNGNSAPVRIGALTLNSGESLLECAAIDSVNGYAYFATATTPSTIIKVALGSGSALPTRVASLVLTGAQSNPLSAVIDSVNGFAYFGTDDFPGYVVKVAVGTGTATPTQISTIQLNTGENELYSAGIDALAGYAYFGTKTIPGIVVKVSLGAGTAPPARVGAVALNAGENGLYCGAIDTAGGFAYFGAHGTANGPSISPSLIVKVGLGGSGNPVRIGSLLLSSGETFVTAGVIDSTGSNAYFACYDTPSRVVKVSCGVGSTLPNRIGAASFAPLEALLSSAVFDPLNGYAYYATSSDPGDIIKIAEGPLGNPPSRVGALILNSGEMPGAGAAIDTANGFAYFGTNTNPASIIKVAVGSANSLPSRVASLVLNSGESNIISAFIDNYGYGYFVTGTNPAKLIKVSLGTGTNAPTRIATFTFVSGESVTCSSADLTNGYAYFGTNEYPGRVIKLALTADNSPPIRITDVLLGNVGMLGHALLDVNNGFGYFIANRVGNVTGEGALEKIALANGNNPPVPIGNSTGIGLFGALCATLDASRQVAYGGDGYGTVLAYALGSGNTAPVASAPFTYIPPGGVNGGNQLTTALVNTNNATLLFSASWFVQNGQVPVNPARIVKLGYAKIVPPVILIIAGNNQTATVNTNVAVAPQVQIKDQSGNNVTDGTPVTFTLSGGGGTITGGSTTTTNGIATLASWTLGGTPGINMLTVTCGTLPAVTITATGVPLTFASLATASPLAGNIGDIIHFNATASDANAVVSWDFGDGSGVGGNSVNHVFTAAGLYTVTATASLGAMTTSSIVSVQISVLGSGEAVGKIKLTKLGIALKFADPQSVADAITIQGALAIKQGFTAMDKHLVLNVGGILREFDLDGTGSGNAGQDKFAISLKQKKGITVAQSAKFSILLTGNFKGILDQIGFKNTTNKKTLSLPVETDVSLDGAFYKVMRKEKYRSVLNVSGTAN